MGLLKVKDRSMENQGGELTGHTPVLEPNSHTHGSPTTVNSACPQDGSNAVAEKVASDSVFRGTGLKGLPVKSVITPSDSVAHINKTNQPVTNDSVANPNLGFRNHSFQNFVPPGVPAKPGQPE